MSSRPTPNTFLSALISQISRFPRTSLEWLRGQGTFFVANLGIGAFLVWLVFPYFGNVSAHPAIFGRYSYSYFCLLFALIALPGLIISLAIAGSAKLNKRIFFGIVLLFVICESATRLILRFHLVESDRENPGFYLLSPFTGYSGKPFATVRAENMQYGPRGPQIIKGEEKLNSLGFRGPTPTLPKNGEYRIIMLGGSTVWEGFPLERSKAGQLEAAYRQAGYDKVRVYNWGLPGYVSGQEMAQLVRTVLDYEPDLIVVYDGTNDAYLPFLNDPRPGYPHNWERIEHEFAAAGQGNYRSLPDLSNFVGASKFFFYSLTQLANNRLESDPSSLRKLRNEVEYRTPAWTSRIVETYMSNHSKMCSVARGANIRVAFFLQPILLFKNPVVGNESSGGESVELHNHVETVFRKIQEEIREKKSVETTSANCFVADLSEIFRDYPREAFVDPVHVDNDANTFIAQQIFQKIKDAGWLSEATPPK